MVAAAKTHLARLRGRLHIIQGAARRAVRKNNKAEGLACEAMLEDLEREIAEYLSPAAASKVPTSTDYKRFIKPRAQQDSENLLGWSRKEAEESGIGLMVTLYDRHLKDLGKSSTNFLKIALSVMQAYVETPMAVSRFMYFVEGLADDALTLEQILLRTTGGERGVAFDYVELRLRANCRPNPAVDSTDATYCPKRLIREIKSGAYGTCQATKEIVEFLVPLYLYLTQPRNPFTMHEWDTVFRLKLNADGDHNVRTLAESTTFSKASLNTIALTRYLRPANEPEMILSGGFLRVLSQGKPDEASLRPTVNRSAPPPTRETVDLPVPRAKAHRTEQGGGASLQSERENMGRRVRQSGLCRYCGNADHPSLFGDALKKGQKQPTECPYYQTSKSYDPMNVWAYAHSVLENRAQPVKERRTIDGKAVPLP
jgi:hypothetical protein